MRSTIFCVIIHLSGEGQHVKMLPCHANSEAILIIKFSNAEIVNRCDGTDGRVSCINSLEGILVANLNNQSKKDNFCSNCGVMLAC